MIAFANRITSKRPDHYILQYFVPRGGLPVSGPTWQSALPTPGAGCISSPRSWAGTPAFWKEGAAVHNLVEGHASCYLLMPKMNVPISTSELSPMKTVAIDPKIFTQTGFVWAPIIFRSFPIMKMKTSRTEATRPLMTAV